MSKTYKTKVNRLENKSKKSDQSRRNEHSSGRAIASIIVSRSFGWFSGSGGFSFGDGEGREMGGLAGHRGACLTEVGVFTEPFVVSVIEIGQAELSD